MTTRDGRKKWGARNALQASTIEGSRIGAADELIDQIGPATLQAYAMPEIRRDQVARMGERQGNFFRMTRRGRRIDPT
jgi:hypothetical protein